MPPAGLHRAGSSNEWPSDEAKKLTSQYKNIWDNAVDKGSWKNPTSYKAASVLILRWQDTDTHWPEKMAEEIAALRKTFEDRFNFDVQEQVLENNDRVQSAVNKHVIDFVYEKQDPDSLLIVYYAGHGSPGEYKGALTMQPLVLRCRSRRRHPRRALMIA